MFGKLYAEFSIKWVFLIGLSIFEVGSIICAAAPSSVVLIVGRAIAGIGAAAIYSGALIVSETCQFQSSNYVLMICARYSPTVCRCTTVRSIRG
jgi:MFS family permease